MDDSCAVCAEALEWVAYGACGHKEVCSTCVARLRFICDERRCCICKTESAVVFVTKALGDYTRMINDFSLLPSELREGRVGSYWYHEDTQAFFDDLDQYKMIKAMCRLSCSVCDKLEENSNDGLKRKPRLRSIGQLKGHLFHQHRLLMCSLCLEGRKVFICEQKLYTRAQLNKHIQTGDSEVDGTENERGGFMGHPICEFCRTPFYGDNELYSHMSTEHYTCHICQRQHPGQYEYYKNYDDLEIHFRREHFLCEDEACLGKKFIVFTSESELKRHNALEHGGSMSRSKRNAALQIPTSFRYRRSNEQSNRRGRIQSLHRDYSEDQLPTAIEASYETSNIAGATSSSSTRLNYDNGQTSDVDLLIAPLESLAVTDSELSSRYLQAVSLFNSRNAPLQESSFPPLPVVPTSNQQKSKRDTPKNTMASHLRCQNNVNVGVSSPALAWPSATSSLISSTRPVKPKLSSNGFPELPAKLSSNGFPELPAKLSSNGFPELPTGSVLSKTATNNGAALPTSYSSLAKTQPASFYEHPSIGSSSSSVQTVVSSSRIRHSTSASYLASSAAVDTLSTSDFPPVSAAAQVRKLPESGQTLPKVEDVHTANKTLVERMRSALEFDEDKFTAFKEISGEYRLGVIDAETYLAYVDQFGLSHLVLELARLCPDPERQRTLVETYNANLRRSNNGFVENGWGRGSSHRKDGSSCKKGKGKCLEADSSNDNLADSVLDMVRKLQSSYKPSVGDPEVLSKDGYRASKGKGKLKIRVDEPLTEMSSHSQPPAKSAVGGSNQVLGDVGGKSKQKKKTSKFHRVRLGDGSPATILDLKNSNPNPDPDSSAKEMTSDVNENDTEGALPVRGAWRNGGGQRLVAMTTKGPRN